MDKAELRRMIREKKRAMTTEEIENRSAQLGEKFAACDQYLAAKTIFAVQPGSSHDSYAGASYC